MINTMGKWHKIADLYGILSYLNYDKINNFPEIYKSKTLNSLNGYMSDFGFKFQGEEIFSNKDFIFNSIAKLDMDSHKIGILGTLLTMPSMTTQETFDEIKNEVMGYADNNFSFNVSKLIKEQFLNCKKNDYPTLIHRMIDNKTFDSSENQRPQSNGDVIINTGTMAIAKGNDIRQELNVSFLKNEDKSNLEHLGVEKEDIKQLDNILKSNTTDKSELKSKIMKWLGSVTSSIAGRGLYDNLPEIVAFVTTLIP